MAELNLGRVKGEKGERGLTEEEEQAIIQVKNETIKAKEEAISATGELEQIKTEVDTVKNQAIGATENANDKIVDVESRFQSLTSEQQGDSEVIDARQGKASLVENVGGIKDDLEQHKLDYVEQVFEIENSIKNGDFADTSSWVAPTSYIEYFVVENNEARVIFNNTGQVTQGFGRTKGHKYYFKILVKSTSCQVGISVAGAIDDVHSGSGEYESLSVIHDSSNTRTYVEFRIRDERSSGYDAVYFKKCVFIRLTEVFGKGNEPTKEEVDLLLEQFPNEYFEGEITLTQKQQLNWQLDIIRKQNERLDELENIITELGGSK